MLLIPYGADVPLYYRPWATVGLIVTNVVVYVLTFSVTSEILLSDTLETHDGLTLQFGAGLHPTQWVSAAFMHIDPIHLVGNMLFLWPFGLVVEGKIGWWRFLTVYLGIAVVANFILQLAMLGASPSIALGASTAIFGLIGVALIWAPRNDLDVFYSLMLFRFGTVEIPILGFAALYFGLNLLGAFLDGFQMGTSVLHLCGAVIGLIVGVFMLKRNLVDCENWDVFAVWADRAGEAAPQTQVATITADDLAERKRSRHEAALAHIREMLTAQSPEAALALDDKMRRQSNEWTLPLDVHTQLIRQLHELGVWEPSLELMVEYLRRFPENSTRMRLRLAQVLITKVERPAQGMRVLAKIPAGSLDHKLEAARAKMLRQAQILRDEGAIELETEDW